MSITHPSGAARHVNRATLTLTLVASLAVLVALGTMWVVDGERSRTATSLVYGASLVACSLASFLYHMLENARRRPLLRHLDHAAIFLLIAGTYTPFAATGLAGPFGVSLLAWVWGLSLAGIVLKLALGPGWHRLFVAVYVAVGWIGVTALGEIVQRVPAAAIVWLGVGALAYTIGAALYARDIGRWTEPVWHALVLAGILAHFAAVLVQLEAVAGA